MISSTPDIADAAVEELTFLDGGAVASRNFQVSLSLRCGHRCLFCPVALTGRDLSADAAAEALRGHARRRARRLAETELILTGGEPALSKSLLETARLGRKLGFRSVTMLSSAASFADPAFARAVHAAGVRRLFLSLHSPRAAVHDLLTGTRRRFPLAVRGMINALRLPFAQVTCNMVLTRHNHADIPAHAAFLARLRARARARAPLTLSLSALEENPRWEDLCVPHSASVPHALRAHAEGAVPLARFMGNWAIPVCVGGLAEAAPGLVPAARWDTPVWYAPAGWSPSARRPPSTAVRVKARACRACPLDGVCAGLSRTYAGHYGVGELAPVAGRPPSARRGSIHIA
ncbi:MAG: radical SAM protein [Elusimicrobia bacterium]|nr:radical SAM protein [Elusimicrobiota bacterium]